jgi:carotenoid cleavage dioxygenase
MNDALPAYLAGHLAPVPDEIDAFELPVTGALPPELRGRYFRNGPNPLPGQDPGHWFAGHGMIHGIRLNKGRAEWYRNRWVQTRSLRGASFVRPDGGLDRTAVPANTHVIHHGERILALVENGFPYEVTPELKTVGPCDFDSRLTTAMTAHPKEDPITGELHFFGYGFTAPYLTYHRLTASGELAESRQIGVAGPTMMHDFAMTEHHVIWLDLPVVFDPTLVGRAMPYRWEDSYRARLGVMRRDGTSEIRWYDIEPSYVFHVGNAREDASGQITLEAIRYSPAGFTALWATTAGYTDAATAAAWASGGHLHRWTLDPVAGTVKEEQLDDRHVEFPTINEDRIGRPSRYLYTVAQDSVIKYDTLAGAALTHCLPGREPGEAVFVPAADYAEEDHGWLLSIVTDRTGDSSDLVVLDASDLRQTAKVSLPRRVPAGFHGSWIPDA